MAQSPPEGMPTICPYLYYQDVRAALAWLARAFGLEQHLVMPGPGGSVMHAELVIGAGMVMLGPASDEHGSRSPRQLPAVNQSLYVYVRDVDAHFARAKAEGATILCDPIDMFWGDRFYRVADLEGHRWCFAQHVRDVPMEEWKQPGR